MSDLTPKPVRSACPPGAPQLPGGAKLGLGEDAKVGVEVSPKKMLWLSGRHGRVFLKEDGTAGFKTKAIKIKSLAKVAVGASAKQGKIKAAAPDVSVTDLKLKLAGAAALVTMGKALPVAQSIKVPGTPASVLLAANVGAPSPLPDKGGWALDLQALNVSLRC